MPTQPLAELTTQSAKIGKWVVRVCDGPVEHEYTYTFGGKQVTGKNFTVRLVSPEGTQYCLGKCRQKGREPLASKNFKQMMEKFQEGTVWNVNRVSLTTDKPLYVSSPIKAVVDIQLTTFQAVLQSTLPMPAQATPPEDLETLLDSPENQRVDVTALLVDMTEERVATTAKDS